MSVQENIETKLGTQLEPHHLEVHDESHMHSVPPGAESHFRLLVVAPSFAGVSRLQRHRTIHALLSEEIAGGVHALAIEAFTPEEWKRRGEQAAASPACRGGSKRD